MNKRKKRKRNMRTINISEKGFERFLTIKKSRSQDSSRAETFDYILKVFERCHENDPDSKR